jgi:tyrosyl-tRNA synthetase
MEGAEINTAKKLLADEVTRLCRGDDAAAAAAATAAQTFEQGRIGGDLPSVAAGPEGISIIAALRELGFVASNKEARRKLEEGAVKVAGSAVRDPHFRIIVGSDAVPVSLGSKRHGLVRAG